MPMSRGNRVLAVVAFVGLVDAGSLAGDHPLPAETRARMQKRFDKTIARTTDLIEKDPKNVSHYSRRGDAYFFSGRFQEAVGDYEKVVELNPEREALHWQRGIAYFYTGQYKKAAHQFKIYHTVDDVDRENGIWRFFSQAKAYGLKKAREGLFKYKKDDREPFPSVYQIFAGKITPQKILDSINTAQLDASQREKRLFYAQLYIGLHYGIENNSKLAAKHLREAVANKWGPTGGYGPSYMWHVGRLHYDLLTAEKSSDAKKREQ